MTLTFAPDIPLALVACALDAVGLQIQATTARDGSHHVGYAPRRCAAPHCMGRGTLSRRTDGAGPWYCHTHFEEARNDQHP